MMPYTIEMFDLNAAFPSGAWNAYLEAYPEQATVFHTEEWIKTLQGAFGYKPKILIALGADGGSCYAAMPFMIDTRLGIQNYLSMPFDTYGGAIGEVEYSAAVQRRFLNLPGIGVRSCVDYHNPGAVTTEIMDISPDESELWKKMHKDNRTAIRSAENNGVDIRVSNRYYEMFDKIPKPLALSITKIMLPVKAGVFFGAKVDDEVVAVSLFFIYNGQAMYWANTVTPEGRKTNANYLLMWEAIKYAKTRECTIINFGASPENAKNLVKFKKTWGTISYSYAKTQRMSIFLKPFLQCRKISQLSEQEEQQR